MIDRAALPLLVAAFDAGGLCACVWCGLYRPQSSRLEVFLSGAAASYGLLSACGNVVEYCGRRISRIRTEGMLQDVLSKKNGGIAMLAIAVLFASLSYAADAPASAAAAAPAAPPDTILRVTDQKELIRVRSQDGRVLWEGSLKASDATKEEVAKTLIRTIDAGTKEAAAARQQAAALQARVTALEAELAAAKAKLSSYEVSASTNVAVAPAAPAAKSKKGGKRSR